jgi:hypothetical protein
MKFLAATGDLYGLTWALAVVFGSTFADKFSLETSWNYKLFVLIFMAICVPISCLPIVGQVSLQLCFLTGHTIMVLLMVVTIPVAYLSFKPHFGRQVGPVTGDSPSSTDASDIISLFQVLVFSTTFQFLVPGITAKTRDKTATICGLYFCPQSYLEYTLGLLLWHGRPLLYSQMKYELTIINLVLLTSVPPRSTQEYIGHAETPSEGN